MNITVTLENAPGVVMESRVIEIEDGADSFDIDDQIQAVIEDWILSVGDTIKIVEVTPQ